MSRPRVKICGVTTESNLEIVVAAGADAVGITCDVPVDTPREVSVERATELADAVPPFVTAVLVTMPDDVAHAVELVETVDPDAVQIHDGLEPDELETVRSQTGADVLYAVDADDPAEAKRYDGVVDALVIDSVDEDGGGGTGETHDWDRTREVADDLESPLVLAGGLTPDNVANAVETVEPFAVDVASGVEAEGGVKDDAAVESFVERATTASRTVEPAP
ncbi:phosphoribosylanthranilate isomerase [Natronobacterium texcoconense]|uniref:N-(5'-phosphoribosyl)anthranilate isomerase n=1 Tax=Natronobacterium texcoconense TaxID=1095778 RepID=A0A1H1EF35_NATTX|nr:phosphoribosylanthranilate isomerase [Natronobacterium texcoconense]SDQ87098.1 phosphoribosylanthranilate isomerase [Natronobacterium texcoconense]